MAHKKRGAKHHKPKKHGRRVGGLNKHALMDDAMGLLGLAAGQIASTTLQRQMTSMNHKVVGGIQIVGGMMLKHHSKGHFMQGLGWGIAGAGTIGVAHDIGLIHGVDTLCDQVFNRSMSPGGPQNMIPPHQEVNIPGRSGPMPNVSGMNNFDYMSGINNFEMMSGHDDQSMKDEYEHVQSLGL